MESERKSSAWWFIIGLICTMLLCICLAVGLLGTGLIARAVSWFTSGEVFEGLPTEDLPSSTNSGSPTPTQEIRVPLGDSDLDMARAMQDVLKRTLVPENDPITLAEQFQDLSGIPRMLAESAEPISLGTVESFWVSNLDENTNSQVLAELAYASNHVYFWIAQGVETSEEDLKALVDYFEETTYPTNRAFFGHEWEPGVDGDSHLYVLYARDLGYSVAGYYSPADELSPLAHEYSNGHEMFYLNADNVFLWEPFTYGVLAHEFQHMIHWYRDRNEDTWLNEGMSELAALLDGHYEGGFDTVYLTSPDQTLAFWPGSGESEMHYGQAFLFVTYFMDRFGPEITRAVVDDPMNGLESIDHTLESMGVMDEDGTPLNAEDVYGDWAAALWARDASISDGRYSYVSYTPNKPVAADTFSTCPLEMQTRAVSQYGLDYIRLQCEGDYTLVFDGESVVPVVPIDPHSGKYAFWSNRGDESDMSLTRRFDLTGVEGSVVLEYWMWHDIEEGWDYLYLLASDDGGETWQILETPSGSDVDTSGNAYGWGYTGFSGGVEQASWVQESVDLSAYTGREVLLRFEYITDAAVHGEGFILDDVSIDAIGYEEGFENGEGGWVSEGFTLLYNRLPQSFRLMLVEQGFQTRVRSIPLDAQNHAEISLALGRVYDEAVLIVIGTTRHTWQSAPYRFSITPE